MVDVEDIGDVVIAVAGREVIEIGIQAVIINVDAVHGTDDKARVVQLRRAVRQRL